MAQFKIAVCDDQFLDKKFVSDVEEKAVGGQAQVFAFHAHDNSQVPDQIGEMEAVLFWHHLNINEEMLIKMKKCKSIVRIGMGYDNVDLKAASKRGIVVSNVPDYGVEEVADHTLTLILMLLRRIQPIISATAEGKWKSTLAIGSRRLSGLTLGLIGCGSIGGAVAVRAKAFGLKVQVYDPYLKWGMAKTLGVTQHVDLDTLLSTSDIVSVHCPLKMQHKDQLINNYHFIDATKFQKMKKGVYFVNTARGPIVDEEALSEALTSGQVQAAGLDVFEKEPYVSGPLLKLPNVIVTPHSAFYSEESNEEMRTKAAHEALRVISGQAPWYQVN